MSTRKNTIMMAVYEVFIYLAPLITAPYIARVLGTGGTGIYSYTYSIATYFVIAIQLGVNLHGRREIAAALNVEERTRRFWGIFACICAAFIISSIVFVVLVHLISPDMRKYLAWQYCMLAAGWLDIGWFFFGIEEFKLAVSRNIIVKILSLFLVFLIIRNADDTLKYVVLMSVTNLVSVLVMWVALPKYICKIHIGSADILSNLKPLIVLAIPVLSIQLYSITDKVFLGLMMNMDSVGIYENMYKLSRVPVALITTIGTVLLPRITNMIAEGREAETYRYIEKSLSLTMIIGSGCCFGLIGISPWLVEMYYGKAFNSGIPVLQILSLVLLVIAWGNVFRNQFIIPRKMDKIYLVSVIAAAIINIILNTALIPIMGIIGAAVASVISEVIVCIYQSLRIKKFFDFTKLVRQNLIYVISGIIMAVIVYHIGMILKEATIINVLILFSIGCIAFTGITAFLEVITNQMVLMDEVKLMYYKFRKRSK